MNNVVPALEDLEVTIDALREELGLVLGERYALRLFFAERHTSASRASSRRPPRSRRQPSRRSMRSSASW